MRNFSVYAFGSILLFLLLCCTRAPLPPGKEPLSLDDTLSSEKHDFQLELLAEGLQTPWSMDWLPDGTALFTDRRQGKVFILDEKTKHTTSICNTPQVFTFQDSGMREVLVHPDYPNNGWIYLSYDIMDADSSSTLRVDRLRLSNNCFIDQQKLFEAHPWYRSGYHYGGRMVLNEGYLYITVGDRHFRDSAQLLHTHNGKIIRLYEDGRVPLDNPFVQTPGALPEIWSYGHRTPQGLRFHPQSGELYEHEHGPKGGDEINIILPGRNYGWPLITYGEEYQGGPIGQGITHHENMEQPLFYYTPSIAPSDIIFYSAEIFPKWKGNLFLGAMAGKHLRRLVIEDRRIIHEEQLLAGRGWRFRFIRQGPRGYLYFGKDIGDIWRMKPVVVDD